MIDMVAKRTTVVILLILSQIIKGKKQKLVTWLKLPLYVNVGHFQYLPARFNMNTMLCNRIYYFTSTVKPFL